MPFEVVKDMAGQIIGSLLVVHRVPGNRRKARWLCKCSCGAERIVTGAHLRVIQSRGKRFTCCTNCVHRRDVVDRLLLLEYRRSANYKGIVWSLNDHEAIELFRSPCFYCGRSGVNQRKYRGSEFGYSGIDRVDSDRGYVAAMLWRVASRATTPKTNSVKLNSFISSDSFQNAILEAIK